METTDRRSFLVLSTLGFAGAAAPWTREQKPALDPVNEQMHFVMTPTEAHRLSMDDGSITESVPSAVLLPSGVSTEDLLLSLDMNPTDMQALIEGTSTATNSAARAALGAQWLGVPNVADIAGAMIEAIHGGGEVNLDLTIQTRTDFPTHDITPGPDFTVFRDSRISRLVTQDFRQEVNVGDWKFQIRRSANDVHPFGTCVRVPVQHFHIEVFHRNVRGGYDYVVNLHIGTYRTGGRRCFALWDSEHTWLCVQFCNPGIGDLQRMLQTALTHAASVARIAVAAWVVAAMAAAAAGVLYFPLLALA